MSDSRQNKPDLSDPDLWDTLTASFESQGLSTARFAEAALARVEIRPSMRVLDVACGTGALAVAAARAGADVTAIDFSPGLVRRVRAHGIPALNARQMDGQALDFPEDSFDAVFSVFGVMVFPDWRSGLREMARVTRPGGVAVVAVWEDPDGGASNLLLSRVRKVLYPEFVAPVQMDSMLELSDPERLAAAITAAGFVEPNVEQVTRNFYLNIAALDDADRLFGPIPQWQMLDPAQRAAVLTEIRARAQRDRIGGTLPIPSTALIVTARRPPAT